MVSNRDRHTSAERLISESYRCCLLLLIIPLRFWDVPKKVGLWNFNPDVVLRLSLESSIHHVVQTSLPRVVLRSCCLALSLEPRLLLLHELLLCCEHAWYMYLTVPHLRRKSKMV